MQSFAQCKRSMLELRWKLSTNVQTSDLVRLGGSKKIRGQSRDDAFAAADNSKCSAQLRSPKRRASGLDSINSLRESPDTVIPRFLRLRVQANDESDVMTGNGSGLGSDAKITFISEPFSTSSGRSGPRVGRLPTSTSPASLRATRALWLLTSSHISGAEKTRVQTTSGLAEGNDYEIDRT